MQHSLLAARPRWISPCTIALASVLPLAIGTCMHSGRQGERVLPAGGVGRGNLRADGTTANRCGGAGEEGPLRLW
jgi:hypothetical protein